MKRHEHEFTSEAPATAETTEKTYLKTGEKVHEDGAYFCINCFEERRPPMVNLNKGDMIPVCPTCTPNARWSKV